MIAAVRNVFVRGGMRYRKTEAYFALVGLDRISDDSAEFVCHPHGAEACTDLLGHHYGIYPHS